MISEKKDGLWDNIRQKKARMKSGSGEKKAKPGDKDYPKTLNVEAKTAAWQRKEGKNPTGGLNAKGRKSYERENPGSDLKAPQPEGGPRKRSFCARMSGVKGPMKDEKGRPTRKALALRKWKCSEETTNETTSLKDELLRTAQKKHKDAKSYKKVMQQGKEAKDKLKDPKGIRGTSKGKWGYYKGGRFRPD